ncbi:SagB-type dehydrogenase family enzyme [Parabacteroides sp. PF5-5]|uniref:nitroreductase family protein n=1 Tax=unclassified Parabacteroides TaxID=2649774 RepID=UPI00247551C8|nr:MULTISPECIES: SagB/ThcOx family dehydrogenase [unclassified Parabacteroides]MDH6306237.1 SagB-type dehydrogenase family enzyme [Parabacteroides sp. PH5-39]MDH6316971.1 SagB-type dehydrogenase family enzyme [Parabacteroides sp. PF5-13]MDH6321041.1 SagB-type dehydrogenase family enzyme [Parabacteroides sp. PH5-13]MDH6324773.1 SagB-type dehydrogenase family enzyme [Parabacteroides sp. PH5-8]MDH6328156.1 SagB-type dehydrogenase family enzyme [Parabacteroides sp. PH5-41]
MKQLSFLLCAFLLVSCVNAQDFKVIKLDPPTKTGGKPLMDVFSNRKSDREFAPEKLSRADLSNLLWATNGINREDGKRTAPSARNVQDVDVYVIMEEGAYLYDAKAHALNPLTPGDHRAAVAKGQDFAATAPLSIVLVTDLSRMSDNMSEWTKLMGAVDVGIVCQNINIACAGMGLATVPRATMDQEVLKKVLKLTDRQLLLMNNPVGYPKK